MTLQCEVEVPIEQSGAEGSAPAEPVTNNPEPDGQGPLPPAADNLPATPEWETQQYEDKVTRRIRQNAPKFVTKDKAAKLAVHIAGNLKDQLAMDLAIWKAIKVGKGRDGEWGPFVEKELKLKRRTADRWVEKKLDSDQLPPWAADRLRGNKKDAAKPEGKGTPEPHENSGQTGESAFLFTKALPEGTEILEWAVPCTADEKAELLENLRFLTVEEAKQLFLEAVRNAAAAKRGHAVDPAATQPESEAAQAASGPAKLAEGASTETAKKYSLFVCDYCRKPVALGDGIETPYETLHHGCLEARQKDRHLGDGVVTSSELTNLIARACEANAATPTEDAQ